MLTGIAVLGVARIIVVAISTVENAAGAVKKYSISDSPDNAPAEKKWLKRSNTH